MIVGWSPYSGAGQVDGGATELLNYLIADVVRKALDGKVMLVSRRPGPETLLGHPEIVKLAISNSRFKHRYSAATLCFARSDVDVARFNAGDDEQRRRVGRILNLFVETAFVGIPTAARSPVFANTHTHTGRLEVNVVVPRFIRRPDERIMSFNPHPPRRGSRNFWDSFRDSVNYRYGMADPFDPDRVQLVKSSDYILKNRAEARRNRVQLEEEDPRFHIYHHAIDLWQHTGIEDRDALLEQLDPLLHEEHGIMLLSKTDDSVTFLAPDGACLKMGGHLFSAGFSELNPRHDLPEPEYADLRYGQLRNAPAKFAARLARRAAFHERRYGLTAAPPDPTALLRNGASIIAGPSPTRRSRVTPLAARLANAVRGAIEGLITRLAEINIWQSVKQADLTGFGHIREKLEKINDRLERKRAGGADRTVEGGKSAGAVDRAPRISSGYEESAGALGVDGQLSVRAGRHQSRDGEDRRPHRAGADPSGSGARAYGTDGATARTDQPGPGGHQGVSDPPPGSRADLLRTFRRAATDAGLRNIRVAPSGSSLFFLIADGATMTITADAIQSLWVADECTSEQIRAFAEAAGLDSDDMLEARESEPEAPSPG
ncbi:MAG: hypothetical protein Q4F71_00725 [Paracoccus sp. (in: a-proteobacteria)]|nr:hypothetical protein [Paracoccus sp. (in: a-proteobacteria)]